MKQLTRAPFTKHVTGDEWGLVGFAKALMEEDIKENVRKLSHSEVKWDITDGSHIVIIVSLCVCANGAYYSREIGKNFSEGACTVICPTACLNCKKNVNVLDEACATARSIWVAAHGCPAR